MVDTSLPKWKIALRVGISGVIGLRGIIALSNAVKNDSPRLMQGRTVHPSIGNDINVEKCCAIAYCGWSTIDKCLTPNQVYEYFKTICELANVELEDAKECNDVSVNEFVGWFDATDRKTAFAELSKELDYIIDKMKKKEPIA